MIMPSGTAGEWFRRIADESSGSGLLEVTVEAAIEALPTLDGWCSPEKAACLVAAVFGLRPQATVEIGVFGGSSLLPLALAIRATGAGTLHGIDPWSAIESTAGMSDIHHDWWSSIDHDEVYRAFLASLKRFGLSDADFLHIHRQTSVRATSQFDRIDLLHIDGNHGAEQSLADVLNFCPKVRQGGIIVFDDYRRFYTHEASDHLDWHYETMFDVSDSRFYRVPEQPRGTTP